MKPSAPDEPSSQPERDQVPDWSEMSDRRCGHCGGPMTPRGCKSCALELARVGNRWRAPVAPGDTQPLSALTGDDGPSAPADADDGDRRG